MCVITRYFAAQLLAFHTLCMSASVTCQKLDTPSHLQLISIHISFMFFGNHHTVASHGCCSSKRGVSRRKERNKIIRFAIVCFVSERIRFVFAILSTQQKYCRKCGGATALMVTSGFSREGYKVAQTLCGGTTLLFIILLAIRSNVRFISSIKECGSATQVVHGFV